MASPDRTMQKGLIGLGLSLAIGLTTAGYFVGQTVYNAKVAINTAEAKGLAERRVTADRANWEVSFSVQGKSKDDLPRLYQEAQKIQLTISEIIQKNGFSKEDISSDVLKYHHYVSRNKNGEVIENTHKLRGSITLETSKVAQVDALRKKINLLIAEGINLTDHAPTYTFNKLNEIKPEMLREATRNARIAATEFADNAGVKVGGIRSARQGNFFIRDAGEEYGDTHKIEKDVRVVTTITFYLSE